MIYGLENGTSTDNEHQIIEWQRLMAWLMTWILEQSELKPLTRWFLRWEPYRLVLCVSLLQGQLVILCLDNLKVVSESALSPVESDSNHWLRSQMPDYIIYVYYYIILYIYIYVILYAFCLWETNGRVSGQASEAFTLKFWEVGCYVECFIDSNQIQHSFDC